jgi:hypothetical protein
VHAAAPTPRAAGRAAKELGDELPRLETFGERMAVPPVRAEDDVINPQMAANPGSDRLLADVGVAGPVHQSALVAASQFLFALSNDLHRAVKTQPRLGLRPDVESSRHEILPFD